MFSQYQGQIMALSAAFCWTFCIMGFTVAARRVGSLAVNIHKLWMAVIFLTFYCGLDPGRGPWLPTDADANAWLWLSLSGVVGFFLGDLFLFRAFIEIGPRLSSLLMSLSPPVAAAVAWVWLGERISGVNLLGVCITIAGVSWVISERGGGGEGHLSRRRVSSRGILYGLLGALGQGVGLVMAKKGMGTEEAPYSAAAATQIRAFAGLACFLVMAIKMKQVKEVAVVLRSPRTTGLIMFGAFFGPFIGVTLLLGSLEYISLGVAQTLASTVPVLILPLSILIEKERVTWRAAIGAAIAVAGVSLLFV